MFFPTEIIFAPTDACNLHCQHCFVSRTPSRLSVQDSINFIQTCLDYANQTEIADQKGKIEKIGFSGGEPFLYLDFLEQIIKFSVKKDLMFDQIMTNGDWWKDEDDLCNKLKKIYDAGYDGKIGLSYDSFHGQTQERIEIFIQTVQELFGNDSINIQAVEKLPSLSNNFNVPVYILNQTFTSEDPQAWKSKKWFKDDFCEGPGQILFVHPNGNIAPCCGFANENPQLFIGNIKNTFQEILKNASENAMLDIVYNKGLSKHKKQLKKNKIKLPGRTSDICSFCDFVCKNNLQKIYFDPKSKIIKK